MHSPASRRINWEDLRYVLAVAEARSLAAASRRLGVNHTTVLRRVTALEERLGLRLFDRLPGGYTLTDGGAELLGAARRMADTVTELERRLSGQDLKLEGRLRVTTTDTLMATVMPALLADFRRSQPGIVIELSTANAFADLARRDADVAIRPTSHPPDYLLGRRIADVAFAIYAAHESVEPVEPVPKSERLAGKWIGFDEELAETRAAQWMRATIPDTRIALVCNSFVAARDAARAGLGCAVLPCYLGDASADLYRVGPRLEGVDTALWILSHRDLRRTARVRAFTDFAARRLADRRTCFEGTARKP